MQLELGFWPRDCVRSVLMEYLSMRSEGIVEETRVDYLGRMEWLCEQLGPSTPADEVTFLVLEKLARSARVVLADRTIKMRLQFWGGAVQYAEQRGILSRGRPKLPPWLQGSKPLHDYYTTDQFRQFRLALPPGRVRRFADLVFWFGGMHTRDAEQTERWMLQPDHVWEGSEQRGRYWRRNTKNQGRKIEPCWIPMESEARELAIEWLASRGDPRDRICGAVHNKRKYFDLAAERCELPHVRPNLGLRSSHSTLLMARGYSYEYVRLVLGHRGEVRAEMRPEQPPSGGEPGGGGNAHGQPRAITGRPTILSAHYLRQSPEILRPQR